LKLRGDELGIIQTSKGRDIRRQRHKEKQNQNQRKFLERYNMGKDKKGVASSGTQPLLVRAL
jgi:hypothetical protein